MISVIIPARNEIYLDQTILDLFAKAKTKIEVVAVCDGYWPSTAIEGVKYVHRGKARGMRNGINSGVTVASGDYLLKADGHCMFAEGFDEELLKVHEGNWVQVPTRKRLDAENWKLIEDGRPDINYLYIDKKKLGGIEWREKNNDRSLDIVKIDDLMTFQGSCWFMTKKYYHHLELMDEENYGTFRKEPQEISFKVWLSGGRVVRNKNTWYAHWHKTKKDGRGYTTSRKDWQKGDDYNRRWETERVWDRQIHDFGFMIQKFNPPGWHPKIYQNLEVEGAAFNPQNPKKANSKFWNEGKFENFVKPHLPKDCTDMSYVDMGCNAGLFLKLAKDHGFRNVVGFEKNRTPVKEGIRYRDLLGYDYRILQRKLGDGIGGDGTFSFSEVPLADVTVLSTMHYYVDISVWLKYVDRLRTKTRYCIVVSRPVKDKHWLAKGGLEDVRSYFKDWEEIGLVDNVPQEGDPHPRELFSVCFKSNLKRVQASTLHMGNTNEAIKTLVHVNGENITETAYYQHWEKRKKGSWSRKYLSDFVVKKIDMAKDVKAIGQKEPLIVQSDGKISDGGHRYITLKELDYKSMIVRQI